jgi:hypothetical protein
VGDGAAALLAGEQPPPKYFNIVPLVMRLLPLIPIVQAVGVLRTLRCLRSWRRNPASRPGAGSPTVRHILTPLIPNLSLAALLAYLRSSRLLGFMNLYMPDLAWIIRICGGFAGVWVFLRTGLTLRALRGSKS